VTYKRIRTKSGQDRLVTTPERSALLGRVRQKHTAPELVVQEALASLGYEYLTNVRGVPGSPDIVSTDRLRAIFVHGCFWHRHPGCPASSTPAQNAEFWKEKFAANVRRDRRNARELRRLGYRVMVVWECQTKSADKRARLQRRLDKFFREPR
jgi:DNA mismatch endonuclease (patch repair protein)